MSAEPALQPAARAADEAGLEGPSGPAARGEAGQAGRAASPRRVAALSCYSAAAAALLGVGALGASAGWGFERDLLWVRGSGWAALVAMLLSLGASPVGRLVGLAGRPEGAARWVAAFRRALGISAAALASVHAAAALATYLSPLLRRTDAAAHLLEVAWLRGGLLSLLILCALWLTSYPRAVRALRVRLWKPLHRLVFVAALFALQHTLLSPLAPRTAVLTAFGLALALGLARLLPKRRGLGPRPASAATDLPAQRSSSPSQRSNQSES